MEAPCPRRSTGSPGLLPLFSSLQSAPSLRPWGRGKAPVGLCSPCSPKAQRSQRFPVLRRWQCLSPQALSEGESSFFGSRLPHGVCRLCGDGGSCPVRH